MIQIVSDPKPMVPTDDTRAGFIRSPEAERAAAADGYYAYVATFTVNSVRSTVTHNIRESFYPGERGQTVTRHFSIENDRLTLIATFREMGKSIRGASRGRGPRPVHSKINACCYGPRDLRAVTDRGVARLHIPRRRDGRMIIVGSVGAIG